MIGALAALVLPAAVRAQPAYPAGPIRFVVPCPRGGPTDLVARLLQPVLQSRLAVTVIIDNQAGAGGNVGRAEVGHHSPADGQTLVLAASGPMAVNGSLFKTMAFNALTDLAPVIQISSFPLVLETHPKLGVTTLKGFIALTQHDSSQLSCASAGNGTPQHQAGEIFNKAVGVKMAHVPYRGAHADGIGPAGAGADILAWHRRARRPAQTHDRQAQRHVQRDRQGCGVRK